MGALENRCGELRCRWLLHLKCFRFPPKLAAAATIVTATGVK